MQIWPVQRPILHAWYMPWQINSPIAYMRKWTHQRFHKGWFLWRSPGAASLTRQMNSAGSVTDRYQVTMSSWVHLPMVASGRYVTTRSAKSGCSQLTHVLICTYLIVMLVLNRHLFYDKKLAHYLLSYMLVYVDYIMLKRVTDWAHRDITYLVNRMESLSVIWIFYALNFRFF